MSDDEDAFQFEVDGWEYKPIPESWIDHENAIDDDREAPSGAVRLFATSVAIGEHGRGMRIRYLHPRGTKVIRLSTGACSPPDGGDSERVPCGLVPPVQTPWIRSYVPHPDDEPDDVYRAPERDHFLDLWGDRIQYERQPEGDWRRAEP